MDSCIMNLKICNFARYLFIKKIFTKQKYFHDVLKQKSLYKIILSSNYNAIHLIKSV